MRRGSLLFLVSVLFCLMSSAAMGFYENPSLNWGYTDFLDGAAISQPPGFVFNPKVSTYSTTTFRDGSGNTLPGRTTMSLLAFAPQLIYTSPKKLPGGLTWGAQLQWFLVSLSSTSNIGMDSSNGLTGDTNFGVFLGRSHVLAKDWAFHWFAEFDAYAPTGSYDKDKAFNAGANFWTFEPFIAATLTMPYGFELSTRQHYLWNTTNNSVVNPMLTAVGDPLIAMAGQPYATHSVKPGEMWHMNFTFSKSLDFISPLLRFGVSGYYGQQTTADQVDGNTWGNSKERLFGIGPAVSYTYIREGERKPTAIVSLKAYTESNALARAEGTRVVFRVIMPF